MGVLISLGYAAACFGVLWWIARTAEPYEEEEEFRNSKRFPVEDYWIYKN